jgi:hypothetical protein
MKNITFNNDTNGDVFYLDTTTDDVIIARYKGTNQIAGIVLKDILDRYVIRHSTSNVWQKTIGSPDFKRLTDFLRYHSIEYNFQIIK